MQDGVGGGRPGVPGHHHVRSPPPDLAHDRLQAQAAAFRVQQPHVMTGVDQGTADHEQPERDLVTHPEVRGDGLVRRVDEEDLHRKSARDRRLQATEEWPPSTVDKNERLLKLQSPVGYGDDVGIGLGNGMPGWCGEAAPEKADWMQGEVDIRHSRGSQRFKSRPTPFDREIGLGPNTDGVSRPEKSPPLG